MTAKRIMIQATGLAKTKPKVDPEPYKIQGKGIN